MQFRIVGAGFAFFLGAFLLSSGSVRADDYAVDGIHSSVSFKVSHLGLASIHGRFNDFSGAFTIDPDASKTTFTLTMKTDSVDTNNQKRDEHLKSPDFFNSKQFPVIEFKSTTVKAVEGGYEVTGNLTMHGVTKPASFKLTGGKKVEFPKGVNRTGFNTDFVIKTSDFGMDKFKDALGDEVHVSIGLEGTKK